MTQKKQATPIWPFMLALVFLFAMSITSPRGWEDFAQRTELPKPLGTFVQGPKPAGIPASVRPGYVASEPTLPVRLPAAGMRAETRPRITSEFAPDMPAAQPNLQPGLNTSPAVEATAIAAPEFTPTAPFRLNGSPRVQVIEASMPTPAAIDLTSSFAAPKVAETTHAATVTGPTFSGGPVAQPNIVAQPNLVAKPNIVAPPSIAAPPAITPKPVAEVSMLPKTGAPTLAPPKNTPPVAVVAPVAVAPIAVTPKVVPAAPKHEAPPAGFSLHGGHRPMTSNPLPTTVAPAVAAPAESHAPKFVPGSSPKFVAVRPDAGTLKKPIATQTPATQPKTGAVDPKLTPLSRPQQTVELAPTVVPVEKTGWPKPADLLVRLNRLKQRPETKPWAERADALLNHLSQSSDPSPAGIQDTVAKLRAAVADMHLVDERELDPGTAVEVRLTRHAIIRRLDVWESLGNLLKKDDLQSDVAKTVETKKLELCLVELDRQVSAAGETGLLWRNYLMLDSLGELAEGKVDQAHRRSLAQTVLERLRKAGASSDQNAFLNEGPFAQLHDQLRGFAAEEVDGRKLLESIERFEAGGLPADGHALAAQCQLLDVSVDEERRQLATWLTSHYRNANIRVTLSADLLNRMMPPELTKSAPVNEIVLGLPTHGWSTTRTGVGIRFMPSQDQLAMRMEAEGAVQAQTQTHSGPVRVFNQSDSNFIAHKDIALTPEGVVVQRAVASTHSRNKLRGIRTDFDHMPILGSIVESIAMDQHAEKKDLARAESQARVSRGVERGLDAEIDKHLKTADATLSERIIAPLAALELAPEVIELQSNEARAIMRIRIAGDDQLASHTPRPRAYSDNVGSVQVHQSAVNNVLEKSNLAGRRFTLPELYRFVVEKYYLPDDVDVSTLPEDLEITFAQVDPITVRLDGGQVELRLAIEELSRAGKSWRDFVVKARFKTEVVKGRTCFVRDGSVNLSGPKLSATSQIPLRTVFAKVFPDDMCVVLWPDKYRNDPRFADLDIEQVDVRDGWIGMAIGPRRLQASALLPPKR